MDELLESGPPEEEEMIQLRWEPHMLDLPIYQRSNGQVESARTFRALQLSAS
jgi:hypothetical protein